MSLPYLHPYLGLSNGLNTKQAGGAPAAGTFNSMYENFQALTSVQVSHFVEWFSGSSPSSIWTKTDVTGSGTFTMSDEIDGGAVIETSGTVADHSEIHFNAKRHYDPANFEQIFITKKHTTITSVFAGIRKAVAIGSDVVSYVDDNTTYKRLLTNKTGNQYTDTSVLSDTAWTGVKIIGGASDIKLYINGVLEATNATQLPTINMCPNIICYQNTTGANAKVSIRFMEVYNTSVSINSSLYERLSALTQVAGQRVVETFSGSDRQTTRWTKTESGAGTAAMADEVDGGFTLYPASSNTNYTQINFNNINQYDEANSVMICVFKQATHTGGATTCQMATTNTSWNLQAYGTRLWTSDTYFLLRTADASTVSNTNSSITKDTSFHNWKFEASASDIKLYLDGVLEVTKTTNRPTTPVQPVLMSWNENGNRDYSHFRYLEAYNKLGTETSYPSVYQMFNPLTTVAKAHFWEWFDGNGIDTTRWTQTDDQGSNTKQMSDGIDQGFEIVCGSNYNDRATIHFNNKRHYDPTASVYIAVQKVSDTNMQLATGLSNDSNFGGHYGILQGILGTTYYTLSTNAASASSSNSTVAFDSNWHTHKLEFSSSDVKLYIDGVLEVTKTTDRPTNKCQAMWRNGNRLAGAGRTGYTRYIEAYNT